MPLRWHSFFIKEKGLEMGHRNENLNFKRVIISIIGLYFCLQTAVSHAQQLPLFTQYSEFGGLVNPAHIPFDNLHFGQDVSVGVAYRDQWIQLPDRPKTLAARYEKSTNHRHGANLTFGGTLLHDEIGVFTTTEIKGRLATFFKTKGSSEIGGFSLGINFGLSQYRANLADFAYIDIDPILFRENTSAVNPDLGIGVAFINEFKNRDYLQVGFSVPQIFGLDHTYKNSRKQFDIKQVPHFYLSSNYYKSGGIIHTEAGWIYSTSSSNQLRIGYAFNPTFYSHSVIFGNIHELNLSYSFRSAK